MIDTTSLGAKRSEPPLLDSSREPSEEKLAPLGIPKPEKRAERERSMDLGQLTAPPPPAAKGGVQFAGSSKNMVYDVSSRFDRTPSEREATWITNMEFKLTKMGIVQTLRKMVKGKISTDDEEARGLENETPKARKAQKIRRQVSLNAVLDEQDRQQLFGTGVGRKGPRSKDHEAPGDTIARLYQSRSAPSARKALKVGARDAQKAQEDLADGDGDEPSSEHLGERNE